MEQKNHLFNTNTSLASANLINSVVPVSEAKIMYDRLVECINEFEEDLNEEQEIGARLVSFGNDTTFYIEEIGYYSPSLICFYGYNPNTKSHLQLVQHVSQVNVLLVAMPKINNTAKRIGFRIDEE